MLPVLCMIFVALSTLQSISAHIISCAVYANSGVAGNKEIEAQHCHIECSDLSLVPQ